MATLKECLDQTQQYLSRVRDSPEVLFSDDSSLTSRLSLAGMNCQNLNTGFAVDNLGQILVDMQKGRFNGFPVELAALKRNLEGSQRVTSYFFEELENKVYSIPLNLDWEGVDDYGGRNIDFIDKMSQFALNFSYFKDQFLGDSPGLANPVDLAEQFSYLSGEMAMLHGEMKQRYGKNKQMETLRTGIQNNWNQLYGWIGGALKDAYQAREPGAFIGNAQQQGVNRLYLGN